MNVFVLCTGRNGSTSFVRACEYITNYSATHQSRSHLLGDERIAFPDDHIESVGHRGHPIFITIV